ncbi:MAG: hypothetical protein SGILL_009960 [Bacillariaceae sp.]
MKQQLVTRLRDSPFFLINTSMDNEESLPQEQRFTSSDRKPLDGSARSSATSSRRSQSIPLPSSHVQRTHSEVQLCEDMESAERRDLNMFYRLVNGIRERQVNFTHETDSQMIRPLHPGRHQQQHPYPHDAASLKRYRASKEAETCVAHIIHTRNTPLDKTSYMHTSGSNEQSSSLPQDSGHQALQAATLALQALNQGGASSDPEKHQEQEDHFQQAGWSLSGFEEEVAPLKDPDDENLQQDDDEEDEGIFDLDL